MAKCVQKSELRAKSYVTERKGPYLPLDLTPFNQGEIWDEKRLRGLQIDTDLETQ